MTLFKKKFMRVPNLHFRSAIKEIGRNAYVDWILVIFISLVIIIILVAGGLNLYWQISSGNFKGSGKATNTTKKVFNEEEFLSLIEVIKNKEEAVIKLKGEYSGPIDPIK